MGGYEGYFHGNCAKSSGNSDVINSNKLAASKVKNAEQLISFLHSRYNEGGQNKIGAAFVVKTMLGKDADGGGTKVTSGEWNDIEDILTALDADGAIKWNQTVDTCSMNSYYQSTEKDDAFYDRTKKIYGSCDTDPAIKFYNSSNKLAYVLDRKCANPIGTINKLDKPWKVSNDPVF